MARVWAPGKRLFISRQRTSPGVGYRCIGRMSGAGGSDKGRTMQDVQQHDVVRIRENRESCKSSESDIEYLRYWALGRDREAAVRAVSARTEELISTTGTGYALSNQDLSGLDLSGFDLRRATLNRAQLHSTKLDHADLSRAALICPGMEKTSLRSMSVIWSPPFWRTVA